MLTTGVEGKGFKRGNQLYAQPHALKMRINIAPCISGSIIWLVTYIYLYIFVKHNLQLQKQASLMEVLMEVSHNHRAKASF